MRNRLKKPSNNSLKKTLIKKTLEKAFTLLGPLLLVFIILICQKVSFLSPVVNTICKFYELPIGCTFPTYLVYDTNFDSNNLEKKLSEYKEKQEKEQDSVELMTNIAEAERRESIFKSADMEQSTLLIKNALLHQQQVLIMKKNLEPALISYSLILARLNNFEDAISYINKAIHINPKRLVSYQCQSEIYQLNRDTKKAELSLEKAKKLNPINFENSECIVN